MSKIDDEMNEIVTCKYCGSKTLYGELTWLAGKCMCPDCYQNERAKQDLEIVKAEHCDRWRKEHNFCNGCEYSTKDYDCKVYDAVFTCFKESKDADKES